MGEDGRTFPIEKLRAHIDAQLHKAISVFLFDAAGNTLLQRRAAGKYHGAGLWANACCSHPDWGEEDGPCAHRRLREELGLRAALTFVGRTRYRAAVGDLIEHEDVAVFVGRLDAPVDEAKLNPEEVDAVEWSPWDALIARAEDDATSLAPWTRIYMRDARVRALIEAHRRAA